MFDAAFDHAVSAFGAGAREGGLSADTRAAARLRAAALVAEEGGAREGLHDLHNLTLSMGLPATRAALRQLLRARPRRQRTPALWEAIKAVSPVSEVGCMRVEFVHQLTGVPVVAFLTLDACPAAHDLGRELEKLKPITPAAKWSELLRSMSTLVFIGRAVYSRTSREHIGLVRQLAGLGAEDPCAGLLDLQIDTKNTTLYLNAAWPERVGLYVSFEGDPRRPAARTPAAERKPAASA